MPLANEKQHDGRRKPATESPSPNPAAIPARQRPVGETPLARLSTPAFISMEPVKSTRQKRSARCPWNKSSMHLFHSLLGMVLGENRLNQQPWSVRDTLRGRCLVSAQGWQDCLLAEMSVGA